MGGGLEERKKDDKSEMNPTDWNLNRKEITQY